MRLPARYLTLVTAAVFAAACATTKPPATAGRVNKDEPRRLVGTENGVRIDAEIIAEQLSPGQPVAITYDVTNNRPDAVAIADLTPESSYDADTQTVTVTLGSEIPGYEFLPRLLLIASGETKTFSAHAAISAAIVPVGGAVFQPMPRGLQVKLHFLGDPKPFQQLIGIPERVVRDSKLADALMPKWLERNETIVTNTLPMRWVAPITSDDDASMPGKRRRP